MDKLTREKLASILIEMQGELSQREFAKKLEVSYAAIRSWQNLESIPTIDNMDLIARMRGQSLPMFLIDLGYPVKSSEISKILARLTDSRRFVLLKDLMSSFADSDLLSRKAS